MVLPEHDEVIRDPIWLRAEPQTSTSVDWYSTGQSRTVECDGVTMTVRFVGRKGRRGRIVIEAPAGAVFSGEK